MIVKIAIAFVFRRHNSDILSMAVVVENCKKKHLYSEKCINVFYTVLVAPAFFVPLNYFYSVLLDVDLPSVH